MNHYSLKPKIKLINKKGVLKINEYPINNIKKTIRFTSYYNNPTTFIGSGRSIKSYNRIKPDKTNQSENLENIYFLNKINTSNNLNNNNNNYNYQYHPSLTDSICSNNQTRIKSELINPKNTLLNKMINLKNNNNSVENNFNNNDNIIINENDENIDENNYSNHNKSLSELDDENLMEITFNKLGIDKIYLESFKNNKVKFNDLLFLSKEDFKEMNIPIGPRNRILSFINKFIKYLTNFYNNNFTDNNDNNDSFKINENLLNNFFKFYKMNNINELVRNNTNPHSNFKNINNNLNNNEEIIQNPLQNSTINIVSPYSNITTSNTDLLTGYDNNIVIKQEIKNYLNNASSNNSILKTTGRYNTNRIPRTRLIKINKSLPKKNQINNINNTLNLNNISMQQQNINYHNNNNNNKINVNLSSMKKIKNKNISKINEISVDENNVNINKIYSNRLNSNNNNINISYHKLNNNKNNSIKKFNINTNINNNLNKNNKYNNNNLFNIENKNKIGYYTSRSKEKDKINLKLKSIEENHLDNLKKKHEDLQNKLQYCTKAIEKNKLFIKLLENKIHDS